MQERINFVKAARIGTCTITQLCSDFDISRKTAYKWLARHELYGLLGLDDLCRAPRNFPNAISQSTRQLVIEMRKSHRHWGPATLAYMLARLHPDLSDHPAVSTIALILKQNNLIKIRRHRSRCHPTIGPLTDAHAPNDVWCADFKGHFSTKDNCRCNPLTITDNFSRYLLNCRHLDKTGYDDSKTCFKAVFKKFGLPRVIRSDNGSPFASTSIGGLSRLSCWWIKLGIRPERIQPGKPQQNGRHERMHLTLKQYAATPPADNLISQQIIFDEFIDEYNYQRPHQALEMKTPGSIYYPSDKTMPEKLPQPNYSRFMKVRKVKHHGDIIINSKRLFVSQALTGEYIAFEDINDWQSALWFYDQNIAVLNKKTWKLEDIARPQPAGVNPCTTQDCYPCP